MKRFTALSQSLFMAFVGVPLLAHCVALCGGIVAAFVGLIADALGIDGPLEDHLSTAWLVLICLMMFACGRVWARENQPEASVEWRHCFLLLPAILGLICWIFVMQQAGLDFMNMKLNWLVSAFIIPWMGIFIVTLLEQWYWGLILLPIGSQVSFALGYGGKQWLSCRVKWRCVSLAILALCAAVAAFQAWQHTQKFPPTLYEALSTRDFEPSKWRNKITPIRGTPAISFTQNWPRIDGATAALPLYSSAFYGLSILPKNISAGSYLDNSGTPQAYKKIIDGETDIIFAAQPSLAQKQMAEAAGVKLVYTPFAREAFVFIVNKDNPIQTLNDAQIRAIYSGAVTQWREVGGDGNAIQAWQRPRDSGSQTAMLANVMQETPMIPAPETRTATAMGEIIDVVAEYQNTQGAIGYTFRYYATQMKINNGIKLLAINGISPTIENIHNGTYPYTVDVYMVTRKHPTAETQKLVDWFLSPQGQQLVQDVGYVPLYSALLKSISHCEIGC
ncbi:PstS family phosphate ABC transporter substrate-binding protein [Salmonella enterica]|nr:PstS family phosphate ABC transporter substrate-binding protein [Salmonella enterica]HAB3815169.1 phosphate ABC transporter substrate-binding protein [Salmonella enterica subsp. salamae]